MGIFSSKPKQGTTELLDNIEKELSSIARERISLVSTQKRIVGYIIIFLVFGLLIASIYTYIYHWPHSIYEAIFNLWPLLLFPAFLYCLKFVVQWYFDWCMISTKEREKELEDQRKDILDNVRENENYKTATELLDRYDPVLKKRRQEKERRLQEEEDRQQQKQHYLMQRENELLRRRTIAQAEPLGSHNSPPARMLLPTQQPTLPVTPPPVLPQTPLPQQQLFARPNRPRTPRVVEAPLLPAERTPIDKIVDYLLGDGPSNRYALICSQCYSHNGMALPADFEFIAFRCPYCQHFNPSKKQREPTRNPMQTTPPRDRSPSVSGSESNVSQTQSSQSARASASASNESTPVISTEDVVQDPVQK